jgi:Outer membrane protein beta-barrel domain
MKKLLLLVTFATLTAGAFAQGFHIGARGAFNSTWLFNKDVSDAGDELDYKSAFGPQFGLSFAYMFSDKAGVSVDVLLGSVNQKYTNRIIVGNTTLDKFESETQVSTIDIPVLFRLLMGEDAYLEVGPQFSLINEVNFESPGGSNKIDDEFVAGSYISAVLGFGYDIALTDNLILTPGLRFAWGLGDVFEEPANSPGYEPTNAAVGGIQVGLSYLIETK